jgi:hypothetical protein
MGGGIVTALFISVQKAVGLGGSAAICASVCVVIICIWLVALRPGFAAVRTAHAAQQLEAADCTDDSEIGTPLMGAGERADESAAADDDDVLSGTGAD